MKCWHRSSDARRTCTHHEQYMLSAHKVVNALCASFWTKRRILPCSVQFFSWQSRKQERLFDAGPVYAETANAIAICQTFHIVLSVSPLCTSFKSRAFKVSPFNDASALDAFPTITTITTPTCVDTKPSRATLFGYISSNK